MAQGKPEPQESQLGDALLDAVRGALRILGGMVQMAAGMTKVFAVAVARRERDVLERAVHAVAEQAASMPRSSAQDARVVEAHPRLHRPCDA